MKRHALIEFENDPKIIEALNKIPGKYSVKYLTENTVEFLTEMLETEIEIRERVKAARWWQFWKYYEIYFVNYFTHKLSR